MKEKYIKDSEIFEKIKEVIYGLYPVKKPRLDSWEYLCTCTKKPEMAITFYFYKDDDGSTKTQVMFLTGTESVKHGISTVYVVDSKLSKQTIGKLISFILLQFPYMRSLHQNGSGFEMNFNLGLENEEQEGISCNKIDIQFETHPKFYGEFKDLFRNYLEYIVDTFYVAVSKTPQFISSYKKYSDKIKKETIESLSYDQLQKFTKLIDEKILRILLSNIDNDYFFELCNTFQKENETTKKKILELKDSTVNSVIND